MEDSFIAKVVYFNKLKEFDAASSGDYTKKLAEAFPYSETDSDENIKSLYDDDDQDEIEIWKVKITVETVE